MHRLRSSEYLVIGYFAYVAAIMPFFEAARPRTWPGVALAAGIAAVIFWAAQAKSAVRDWLPLLFTLCAYREMNWFAGAASDYHLEQALVMWDRGLLNDTFYGVGLRAAIESTGPVLPSLMELCYLLVYAVAPVSLAVLIFCKRMSSANRWWIAYLAGTLGAYALLPYFPSQPPRSLFAGQDLPHTMTLIRRLNLFIVGEYGIHSSVFPSAHVASVFSAAWGLLKTLPERPLFGWGMAGYGVAVSVAAVYGRYHYAGDAAAGAAVSVAALAAIRLIP